MINTPRDSQMGREINKLKRKIGLNDNDFLKGLINLLKEYVESLNTLEVKKHKEGGVWFKVRKILNFEKEYEYKYEKKVKLSGGSLQEDVVIKKEKGSKEIGDVFIDGTINLLRDEIQNVKNKISLTSVADYTSRIRDVIKRPIDSPSLPGKHIGEEEVRGEAPKKNIKDLQKREKSSEKIVVLKCRYCGNMVHPGEKHRCTYGGTRLKTQEVPSQRSDDDGDFILSYIIADSTDSILLGYAIGKNFLGATLGGSYHHSDTTPSTTQDRNYVPDPDFTSPDRPTGGFGGEEGVSTTGGGFGGDNKEQGGFSTGGGIGGSSNSGTDRGAYS